MLKTTMRHPALLVAAFLATGSVAMGCGSPTGPTTRPVIVSEPPATPTVTLTVRVLRRSAETPLEGALVHVDKEIGRADALGLCRFSVPSGELMSVNVSATGFMPISAAGVLQSGERWTFWLENADDANQEP